MTSRKKKYLARGFLGLIGFLIFAGLIGLAILVKDGWMGLAIVGGVAGSMGLMFFVSWAVEHWDG